MAAEKEGDFITALSFLTDSSEGGNNEANTVISAMLSISPPTNIREQAAYYKTQINKWNKIWEDVKNYMNYNYPILVYDFDPIKMQTQVSSSGNHVTVEWEKGIKLVPNRKALVLYNTIAEEWEKIKSNRDNNKWISQVYTFNGVTNYYIKIGIYNKYGELLTQGFRIINSVKKIVAYMV